MAYRMPKCFDSWKQWHECLNGKNICPDHKDGNAIIERRIQEIVPNAARAAIAQAKGGK